MSVLIIGAGIAGSSLAYALSRRGIAVQLIDAGRATASFAPSVLLNPIRGQNGQLVPMGLAGMRATWQLLDVLLAQGYHIPHGRQGLLRPLPNLETQAKWQQRFALWSPDEAIEHRWQLPTAFPEANLTAQQQIVLEIPQAGWLDGQALVYSLRAASIQAGARWHRGQVQAYGAHHVLLDSGERIDAGAVVYCGGSYGAALAGLQAGYSHRQGSVLRLTAPLCQIPVSFGIYATPAAQGGVLGATFEAPKAQHSLEALPLASLEWLLNKASAIFEQRAMALNGVWTGVRLAGSVQCGLQPNGSYAFSGLGSKGFLLGPMLAEQLAEQLV